ncbi:hypothetical protein CCR75_006015 [Bremia lactucae]|uniref:Uncharacterized protein n=1 Tax=Bremia lactucae TaxID=4779 RepID=A0A976FJY2_BRELC|nr:hypothetical protein CCR75_006015 [Bremia lactucae]
MERGGNFRNNRGGRGGRGFGRGRSTGRGARGGGRGRFGGRVEQSGGFQPQHRHHNHTGPLKGYTPHQLGLPLPQQHYPPQHLLSQEMYQPQYQPPCHQPSLPYQQQSCGDDGRGYTIATPRPSPAQPERYLQPMNKFQHFQQHFQQPQPSTIPQQHMQQFQDKMPEFFNNLQVPLVPSQSPSDYADAVRKRKQAYAPVLSTSDQQHAAYQEISQFSQQPPLPPQDQRSDWSYVQDQSWHQSPAQGQHWIQPLPFQDQQWQHSSQLQIGGSFAYGQQVPISNALPPSHESNQQWDQAKRIHDLRQDVRTEQHRPPPSTYVCHRCNQPGHWKQHCPLLMNKNNRYRSQQEEQYHPHHGLELSLNRTGPSAPPLPGAKPQDPRKIIPSYSTQVSNSCSLPPLPGGLVPPLPPGSQDYDRNDQQQPGQHAWRCEACVKSFVIESQHEAHLKTHVTCTDCDFSASKQQSGGFQPQHRHHNHTGPLKGYTPHQLGLPLAPQQYPPQHLLPQEMYQPQYQPPCHQPSLPYQQQSCGDDGRGYTIATPHPSPAQPERYLQPMSKFQHFQQHFQQPQPSTIPQQHMQQFQDKMPEFFNNLQVPLVPSQSPSDYADAVRKRKQAYAPVLSTSDQQHAAYQEISQFSQKPPLPPQDQRSDWSYVQDQSWHQSPAQGQHWIQPLPFQDQQWQHSSQLQIGGSFAYGQQVPISNALPPSHESNQQWDQAKRIHDLRQDVRTEQHRPPPSTYVCHRCNQPGHWKQHCPLLMDKNNRYRSQQEEQYHPHHGLELSLNRTGPSAPPLPGAKPQDPRKIIPSYSTQVSNSCSLPPLPGGLVPPLPPGSQDYDRNDQQQPGQHAWRCEACVKSFVIESQHEAHLKTHVTCTDCDFSASKRVVTSHHQTAHGQYAGQGLKEIDVEGQKFMVLVGNSAEDIIKWREERRKNWFAMSQQPKPMPTPSAMVAAKRKLSVSSDEDLEEGEIEEDEEAKAQVALKSVAKIDTGVPSIATHESPVDTHEPPVKKLRKTMLCKWFSRGQCRFGETNCKYSHDRSSFACRAMMFKSSCSKGICCPFSHDTAVLVGSRERSLKVSKERDAEQQWRGERKSLLRKLLAKDVRVEQHKMLQIVRYLVANDYLHGEEAEPVLSIKLLGQKEMSLIEASEPIEVVSDESTVMDEASIDAKEGLNGRSEPLVTIVTSNLLLPKVEASPCESQVDSTISDSDKMSNTVKGKEERVKDVASSADAEPVDPEKDRKALPMEEIVDNALDCNQLSDTVY